tara:strand:- start:187 stop:1188 length:1002 start_codon:yes stop_codon:yes gene_type:complete
MFTPLTFNKNNTIEVDRFDNSGITPDTSDKANGYSTAAQPTTQGNNLDGTFVVSAFPNSDYATGTQGGQDQWFLFSAEGNSCQTWFGLAIPTADNMANIGNYTNYSPYLGTSGVLKGQITIGVRQRQNCGNNNDGIILINSGSIYDWDNPTPITLAYSVDMTSNTALCSINGETADVLQIGRQDGKPDPTDPMQFTNLTTRDSDDIYLAFGFSPKIRRQSTPSGSFSEWGYYTSSLNQDELNTITGQRYGDPTNVLDKQPQLMYRFQEDLKQQSGGPSAPHQLNGKFDFPNIGNGFVGEADVEQIHTIKETADMAITSGSVYDMETINYKPRN